MTRAMRSQSSGPMSEESSSGSSSSKFVSGIYGRRNSLMPRRRSER